MIRRVGRPGLLGTIARTAVISGTATAVSNRVNRGMADREMRRSMEAAPPPPPPSAPAPGGGADDRIEQLRQLAELKAQGILTDAEFAAEKARILGP